MICNMKAMEELKETRDMPTVLYQKCIPRRRRPTCYNAQVNVSLETLLTHRAL